MKPPQDFYKWATYGLLAFCLGNYSNMAVHWWQYSSVEDRIVGIQESISGIHEQLEEFTRLPRFSAQDGDDLAACVELNFQLHDMNIIGKNVSASDRLRIQKCLSSIESLRSRLRKRIVKGVAND